MTSQILQKNTDVVATLKKVRWDPSSGRARWPAGVGVPRVTAWAVAALEAGLWRGQRDPLRLLSGPLVGQIRRYKANKEVMEKAAEVYTRLKSRVLGPKIEAIQKATRTGTEKERAEVDKAEEALAGEEAPAERAEDELSAGEQGGSPRRPSEPDGTGSRECVGAACGSVVGRAGWTWEGQGWAERRKRVFPEGTVVLGPSATKGLSRCPSC